MSFDESKKEVIVLGAGVIGLTTALKIQETGRYKVTIIAEILPTDPKNIKYASQWAGAHHVSFSKIGSRNHPLDKETFEEMWKMSEPGRDAEACFMRLEQTEFFSEQRESPSPLSHMPEFKSLSSSDSPNGLPCPDATSGETFRTLTIDTPAYLTYLLSRFLARGGTIHRGSVQHISQIVENGAYSFLPRAPRDPHANKNLTPDQGTTCTKAVPPAAVVVCVGLGARYLGGVEDAEMYPIRGQTVLIDAPWVKHGKTLSDLAKGWWTYIIPRRSGIVILGGTLEPHDWNATPRPDTTRWILERTLKLAPELVPPHLRKNADEPPTVDDIMPFVIEEACGLRPGRKSGLRLEAGTLPVPLTDKTIPVIYNYGHAGAGYIASFGSARVALELLDKALSTPEA